MRGESPHRGAQAQPGPQVAGVARQGRAGLGWAGRGPRPARRRARGRGAVRKPGHIKERAVRRGRLFPGWGL